MRKAEADYRGALRLATAPEPFHDLVGFHCQQSAEKYLKALLENLGQLIPKSHALDDLLSLLPSSHRALQAVQRGLLFLTDFAVDPRYPGTATSKREADAALRWAGKVRTACRALLGIPPPRQRRKSR